MIAKFLSILVPLFILMDFIGTIPVFISLTKNFDKKERLKVAALSSIVAGSIVMFFAILGEQILSYFDISIEAVKVGGGLLLLFIAFEMVLSGQIESDEKKNYNPKSIIVSPLAIPMLAGPGCMTFAMIRYIHLPGMQKIMIVLAIICAVILGSALLSASVYIDKILGKEFTRGLEKIVGVIVSFISLEMIMSGLKAYFF